MQSITPGPALFLMRLHNYNIDLIRECFKESTAETKIAPSYCHLIFMLNLTGHIYLSS